MGMVLDWIGSVWGLDRYGYGNGLISAYVHTGALLRIPSKTSERVFLAGVTQESRGVASYLHPFPIARPD